VRCKSPRVLQVRYLSGSLHQQRRLEESRNEGNEIREPERSRGDSLRKVETLLKRQIQPRNRRCCLRRQRACSQDNEQPDDSHVQVDTEGGSDVPRLLLFNRRSLTETCW
jgi:hypothetical protein